MNLSVDCKPDASHFNLPKSENEMINGRGHRLHFRIFPPTLVGGQNQPIGICFWVHGFGGHSNRPEIQNLAKYFNARGYYVLSLDFQGHGYSEGERALVHSHEELLDDLVSFVDYFRYPEKNLHSIVKTTSDEITRQHLRELPFFVMGQSMGGGVIALTSNTFTSYPKYLGSVLLAPYLGVAPVPHWIVLTILKHTVISCFPNYHMPSWLDGMTDPRLTWKHEETIQYAELDTWGNPGAVGYNLPMKWGTAGMFIEMGVAVKAQLHQITFPFLIIHDPGDAVTSFAGSRDMFNLSSTPLDQKELIETPGFLHGTLSNHPDEVCEMVWGWIQKRNSKLSEI